MATYSVMQGSWSAMQTLASPIRFEVFVSEQGVPASIELDANDENNWHFIVLNAQNTAIATARLNTQGKLGRMAVLKPHRRTGAGQLLVTSICDHAKNQGMLSVTCHAQMSATVFYERVGFIKIGLPFDEAGIQHIQMLKEL
ncbi:MAG TPA: GNAT family N-acetyltransferase [Cycloclasticus sp.]|nr:GNAT family N-acetyltransferase [Cycloclasticus sp.]HIL93110.1 GNAT family N-acetyltransferase [Cycloclasticus sp.]